MCEININGMCVTGFKIMSSKYPGFDTLTKKRFAAGTQIAFKAAATLSDSEKQIIFNGGKAYSLSIVWPLNQEVDNAPSILEYDDSKLLETTDIADFTPSEYQNEIYSEITNTENNILVEALAGSGKTSTLVWIVKKLKSENMLIGKNVIYLAFNKSIQEELNEKLKRTNVFAQTTHGFGLSIIKKHFKNVVVENKIYDLFDEYFCNALELEYTDYNLKIARGNSLYKIKNVVCKIVGFMKNWNIVPKDGKFDEEDLNYAISFFDSYNLDVFEDIAEEEVLKHACNLLVESLPKIGEEEICISYDDMLYLPIYFNFQFPKYDLVLTDESQDFNSLQQEILRRLSMNKSRIIVVGDKHQAIYRFRGADSDSFTNISKIIGVDRKCVIKKLPINYRCDSSIIDRAREIVPSLEGNSKAKGTIGTISYSKTIERLNNNGVDDFLPDGLNGSMRNLSENNHVVSYSVLCRINAPLVSLAYDLIAAGKKCHIIGKQQIGVPLKNIIQQICGSPKDKYFFDSIDDLFNENVLLVEGFLTKLNKYQEKNIARLSKDVEKNCNRIEDINQNVECLKIIMMRISDNKVTSIIREIDNLFSEEPEKGVITLSTIHKSKGLEWDVVFILKPELLPHPRAKLGTEEYIQEKNAEYIACTRARNRLYFVSSDNIRTGTGNNIRTMDFFGESEDEYDFEDYSKSESEDEYDFEDYSDLDDGSPF